MHQVSQRWLDHYSSNPASIWSSATMNTNLTASMGRPTVPLTMAHAQRAASQGTLFDADGSKAVEAPSHNALVIEKGMLKLRPPRQKREAEVAAGSIPRVVERAKEQKERQFQLKQFKLEQYVVGETQLFYEPKMNPLGVALLQLNRWAQNRSTKTCRKGLRSRSPSTRTRTQNWSLGTT